MCHYKRLWRRAAHLRARSVGDLHSHCGDQYRKLVRCQLSGIHDPQIQKKFVEMIMSEVGYEFFTAAPRGEFPATAPWIRWAVADGVARECSQRKGSLSRGIE